MDLMKQCKLCPSVTIDARYVSAIQGWRCGACDMVATGAININEIRQATPVDCNLDATAPFVVETREILEDPLSQKLRTTLRMHLRHVESLS